MRRKARTHVIESPRHGNDVGRNFQLLLLRPAARRDLFGTDRAEDGEIEKSELTLQTQPTRQVSSATSFDLARKEVRAPQADRLLSSDGVISSA